MIDAFDLILVGVLFAKAITAERCPVYPAGLGVLFDKPCELLA